MSILNLTQHPATPEQLVAGVIDVDPVWRQDLSTLLTFDSAPSLEDMLERADGIANLADAHIGAGLDVDPAGYAQVMIGGAPFFMSTLEKVLKDYLFIPVYAFSVRESEEKVQADGSVRKVNVFKHAGFVGV